MRNLLEQPPLTDLMRWLKAAAKLLALGAVSAGVGLALASVGGADTGALPCSQAPEDWISADEIFVDDRNKVIDLVWHTEDGNHRHQLVDGRAAQCRSSIADARRAQPNAGSTASSKAAAEFTIADLVETIEEQSQAIERGDCRALLRQDEIARAAAASGTTQVEVRSPRSELAGSVGSTVLYDLEVAAPIVAMCADLLDE